MREDPVIANRKLFELQHQLYQTGARNFLFIDCLDADRFMSNSLAGGMIVRDLRANALLPRSLRVSVGTREHNDALLRCVGAGSS